MHLWNSLLAVYTDKNLKDIEHWIHSHKFWVLVLSHILCLDKTCMYLDYLGGHGDFLRLIFVLKLIKELLKNYIG